MYQFNTVVRHKKSLSTVLTKKLVTATAGEWILTNNKCQTPDFLYFMFINIYILITFVNSI